MKFLYLSFILFLFLFTGCERVFNTDTLKTYTRSIANNSSYDIWLINPDSMDNCGSSLFDSVLVASGTDYEVEILSNEGASRNSNLLTEDYEDCPSICLDSLNSRINGHDSLQLTISLQGRSLGWVYWNNSGGMSPISFPSGECACYLVITDDDIN